MSYSKRIQTLCSLLERAETFADVGCDHGYCPQYMLENGLCRYAVFSDISKGSLLKAQTLLKTYVDDGRATAVLGNGFFGVDKATDQVLIAGMGGSEIVAILDDTKYGFIPKRFVLQPMHDSEKLRRYLVEKGAYIERDYTFFDGKYYDVIVGYAQKAQGQVCEYSDLEYAFGKENLAVYPEAFIKRTEKQIRNIERYLSRPSLQEESRRELTERKNKLTGVLNGAFRRIL